jgi:hypothetical protein
MSELRVTQNSLEVLTQGEELRISQVSFEIISVEEDDAPLRVSSVSLEVISPDFQGFRPVLSVQVLGELVELSSSPFTRDGTHQETQWQVTLSSDTSYSSPVVDETTSENLYFLIAFLQSDTEYRARLRHIGSVDTGPYSLDVVFTTGPDPVNRPNAPVLSIGQAFSSGARITTTAFSHPLGQTTQEEYNPDGNDLPYPGDFIYEIIEQGGDWDDPLIGPISDPFVIDSLEFIFGGVSEETYIVRARWLDGREGILSNYSNELSVTLTPQLEIPEDWEPDIDLIGDKVCFSSIFTMWFAYSATFTNGKITNALCLESFDPDVNINISIWPIDGSDENCSPGERLAGPHRAPDCHEPSPQVYTLSTRPKPSPPFFITPEDEALAKAPGELISGVFRVYVDKEYPVQTSTGSIVPIPSTGDLIYFELSSDDGATFGALPAGSSQGANYVEIDPTELSDGWYILKTYTSRANGVGIGYSWNAYFPFRVGSGGTVSVLDFKSMEEMPEEAEVRWDNTGNTNWFFRPSRGITVKSASSNIRINESALVFPSLGTPRTYEGVVTFSYVPQNAELGGWVNRFASSSFHEPGVLVMGGGAGARGDGRNDWEGIALHHNTGGQLWPFGAGQVGSAAHVGDSISANAELNGERPPSALPQRYGIARNLAGRIAFTRTNSNTLSGILSPRQGFHVIQNRTYGYAIHTMRYRVEIGSEFALVSLQLLGPELEEGVWSFISRPIALSAGGGSQLLDCGECGLYLGGALTDFTKIYSDGEVQFHSLVQHTYALCEDPPEDAEVLGKKFEIDGGLNIDFCLDPDVLGLGVEVIGEIQRGEQLCIPLWTSCPPDLTSEWTDCIDEGLDEICVDWIDIEGEPEQF